MSDFNVANSFRVEYMLEEVQWLDCSVDAPKRYTNPCCGLELESMRVSGKWSLGNVN